MFFWDTLYNWNIFALLFFLEKSCECDILSSIRHCIMMMLVSISTTHPEAKSWLNFGVIWEKQPVRHRESGRTVTARVSHSSQTAYFWNLIWIPNCIHTVLESYIKGIKYSKWDSKLCFVQKYKNSVNSAKCNLEMFWI